MSVQCISCISLFVYVSIFCATARATDEAIVGPYVQDVRPDQLTVVFDSAADLTAETSAGDVRVVTHGPHHEAVLRVPPSTTPVAYRITVAGRAVASGEVRLPDPTAAGASDATRPLTFVVFGDTRHGLPQLARVAAAARRLDPDLALFTGDLAPSGDDGDGWRGFFSVAAPLLADVPLYPALGNHEVYLDPDATRFRRSFVLPDHGRERLYYSFRRGPAAFIVLDGNQVTPAQTAWLRDTLEAARRDAVPHVFVLMHQPPFSVGEHCGAALVMPEWVELFERYRVRAVFAGHDHAYERMERNGVRYFVSGGGGAPLYSERTSCANFDRAARRVFRSEYHLVRVRVDRHGVDVSALPIDEGGPALDAVHFAGGEPMFAGDAPPIGAEPAHGRPWLLAGGAAVFLLAGVLVRRRRRLPG
jgi:hypothetical protein